VTDEPAVVSVSRRIAASPSTIFDLLTDPRRHVDIDGTGMLRGPQDDARLSGVGMVFLMNMNNDEFGDYVMKNTVVEFETNSLLAWAPERHDVSSDSPWRHRWRFRLEPDGNDATIVTEEFDLTHSPDVAKRILRNGERWRADMERTLETLNSVVASAA
jgi:uncharacterized protein YndB with AHSA1/START domain